MEGSQAPAAPRLAVQAQTVEDDWSRGIRLLRLALALYVFETLVGVASLGYGPFVRFLWTMAPTGPYLVPVLIGANGVLLALAGSGLGRLERASQRLEPVTERVLLKSRFAFLLGLAVCLGQAPTWLAVLMDPVGGLYPPIVTNALLWGTVLQTVGVAAVMIDVFRRRDVEPFPGGRRTSALVAAMVGFTILVPIAALLADVGWASVSSGPVDAPGLRVSAVVGGTEVSFLLLGAIAAPVFALSTGPERGRVRRGWIAGAAAIILELALSSLLLPPHIAPWFTAPVAGLPPVAWGAPAAILVVVSVRDLAHAYGSLASAPVERPTRLPVGERPAWWAPYVDPSSGLREDSLRTGSNLLTAALGIFLVLVMSSFAGYAMRLLPGSAPALVAVLGTFLGPVGWIGLLLPIPLAIVLGLALAAMRRAVLLAAPEIGRRILLARACYWIGIGLVLETIPLLLVQFFGSRYGPGREDVLGAIWWGIALLLPFLVGAIMQAEWSLLRRESRERHARTALLMAAWIPAALGVPIAALAATSAWVEPSGVIYAPTPPGVFILSLGAGAEASIALLLAVAFPADTLVPADRRTASRAGLWLGIFAVVLGTLSGVFAILAPAGFIALRGLLFLTYGPLPWLSWGILPVMLETASAILLLIAARSIATREKPSAIAVIG